MPIEKTNLADMQQEMQAKQEAVAEPQGQRDVLVRRKQLQCVLIEHLKECVELSKTENKKFNNFAVIEGDPRLLFNKIINKRALKKLLDLKPYQISALVPKIRLYKMVYKSDSDSVGFPIELKFSDFTKDPEISDPISFDSLFSLEDVFSNKQLRGDGAGIVDVNVVIEGKNAELARNVTTTIKFVFQNIETLLQERTAADVPEGFPVNSYKYSNLISPPGGEYVDKSYSTAKFFRLKAQIGWALPTAHLELFENDADFIQAIQETALVVDLGLIEHSLSFRENGFVDLTVKYMGHIANSFNSEQMDLFLLSNRDLAKQIELLKELDHTTKRLDQLAASNNKKKTVEPELNGGEDSVTNPEAVTATIDKAKKELENSNIDKPWWNLKKKSGVEKDLETKQIEIRKRLELDKYKKYGIFIDKLINNLKLFYMDINKNALSSVDAGGSAAGSIKTKELLFADQIVIDDEVATANNRQAILSPDTVKNLTDRANQDPPDEDAVKQLESHRASRSITEYSPTFGKYDLESIATPLITFSSKAFTHHKNINDGKYTNKEEQVEGAKEIGSPGDGTFLTTDETGNNVRISYFYLGNLLEIAFEILNNKNKISNIGPGGNMDIILGPLLYFNPTIKPFGRYELVNLADVPVSMELFSSWFISNVLGPLRDSYVLGDFLKDILNTLIIPSLSSACYEHAPLLSPVVQISSIELPLAYNRKVSVLNHRNQVEDLESAGLIQPRSYQIASPGVKNFLVLYAATLSPSFLTGNEELDAAQGIYHFHIGSDKGILKKMTFKRQENTYVRTARIVSYSRDDPNIFREIYDCELEFIGNPLFSVGQYIYLNPSISGFGDPKNPSSNAQKIGLGGYFFIQKVEHKLKSGMYETIVNSIWQNFPLSDKEAVETQKKVISVDNPEGIPRELLNNNKVDINYNTDYVTA